MTVEREDALVQEADHGATSTPAATARVANRWSEHAAVGRASVGKAAALPPSRSPRRRLWDRFRRQRAGMFAAVFLVALALVAIFAPWLTPHDPNAQNLRNSLAPTGSPGHPLGTDVFGRDILSRLIVASRVSLLAAVQALGIAVLLGVPLGLAAGYRRGRLERWAVRLSDAVMSFPSLILAITILAARGPGLTNAMIAVGITLAPRLFRLVRSVVLSIREETFIEASRSIGTPSRKIIVRHVVPNVLPPLVIQLSVFAAYAMLAEASLSYLGLGVQPPAASWGSMLQSGTRNLSKAPHEVIWPGLCIAIAVLMLNLLGDALRDSLGRELRVEE